MLATMSVGLWEEWRFRLSDNFRKENRSKTI